MAVTFATLTSTIEDIIDDDSITDVTDRINDAVSAIAGGIRMPDGQISPPLPELYTSAIVSTTVNAYADLPDIYQRNVFLIADSSGDKIVPPNGGDYYSFMQFLNSVSKKDLSESGSVYRACVRGKKLYYQGIPSVAENMTVYFYRAPVDMTGTDQPDGLPNHLAKKLIVHSVCADIFGDMIEDGEGSNKMGATHHKNEFYVAMIDLMDFIGIDAEPIYYGGGVSGFVDGGVCD